MFSLSHEVSSILFYMIIMAAILGFVPMIVRDENAKLFKAMVYMKYRDLPFTVFEIREIYKEECKKHGFKEV